MTKEQATKWVKALRSGKYKQGKSFLYSPNDTYCCLGVLAKINGGAVTKDCFGFMEVLGSETYGLRDIAGAVYGEGKLEYGSLATANDHGMSFAEIADWIEENYQYL